MYECVGRAAAIQTAVDLARRGGSMCLIGLADGEASISPAAWLIKEIGVTSSLAYFHEEFEMVMAMIADGRVDLEPLHTSTVGLGGRRPRWPIWPVATQVQTKVLVDPRV